jgi:hypothetical protein
LIKIHIGPFQTKNLTLPQTKRQSDRPTCGVAALLGVLGLSTKGSLKTLTVATSVASVVSLPMVIVASLIA